MEKIPTNIAITESRVQKDAQTSIPIITIADDAELFAQQDHTVKTAHASNHNAQQTLIAAHQQNVP
jgi:hypothetical protein